MSRRGAADETQMQGYPFFEGRTAAKERDIAMESMDHLSAQDAISAVTSARQAVLKNYDDGELTASERDTEMDKLDNQLVQLAIFATRMAREAVLARDDDGELTLATRSAELRSIDNRFKSIIHTAEGPVQEPINAESQQNPKWPNLIPRADETIQANCNGFLRFQSAATDFASTEVKRIVRAVIEDLRGRPAQGMFGDVAARHMWDEYCWSLQEGPFDDDLGWDNVRLGSLSGAFEGMVRAVIEGEIEKLPRHAQVFLSAKAIEDDIDMDGDALGSIWLDEMVAVIIDGVNSEASGRSLYLIGPERGDVIGHEIQVSGTVLSVLWDKGEAMGLVQSHVDELIVPVGDLSELAAEMVDAYIAAVKDEADGTTVSEFFDNFEDQIRDMLFECDVLPSLEDMRAELLKRLDG
jgi:hypothetical protein